MSGVYSKNNFRSWPFKNLSALQEVSRQLLDQINILRPVSRIKNIQQVIRALDRDGVAILENVVTQQMIQACIDDINTFEEKIPSLEGQIRTKHRSTGGTRDYHVHEYQSDLQVYRSHDPLVFSPNYAKFLMLPEVIEIIRCYLGRSWFYQAMIITRTQAVRWVGKGFDYWHHDARGRKLNIFLLNVKLIILPPAY